MKIGIAADHRGFKLKHEILKELKEINIEDYGTYSEDMVDYPIYAFKIGEALREKEIKYGIVICGSGIGICIAANKVKRVKCALVRTEEEAKYAREHNNSNMVSIPADVELYEALKIINRFINEPFSTKERYIRRDQQIKDYEDGIY